MSASGIIGTFQGVRSPGTAYVLLHHYMGEIDGAFRAWGIPRAAPAASAYAIAVGGRGARAPRSGPRRRSPASTSSGGRATGVDARVGRGDRRPTPSSRAPTRGVTFLDLLEPGTLDAEFEDEVRRFKFRGSSGKVNLALDGLPDFTCLPGAGEHLRGAISFSAVGRLHGARLRRREVRPLLEPRPYIDMIIPTLVDPSMAPPGKHVMSCFVQYAPYHLRRARDVGRRARGVRRRGDRHGSPSSRPNIRDLILGRQVLTPLDIERRSASPRATSSRASCRSSSSSSTGRCPAGRGSGRRSATSGCAARRRIPGGGIMGAPGRIAALEVLRSAAAGGRRDRLRRDRRRRRPQRPRLRGLPRPGRPPRRRPRAPRARRRDPRRRRARPSAASRPAVVARARARAPRPRAGAPGRPDVRAAATTAAPLTFWADAARTAEELARRLAGGRGCLPAFDAHVRVLARFLGELADVDAAAARRRRGRRLAGGPEARPRLSAASAPAPPASSPGRCRWRSPTSWASGSRPTPSAARWPPGARCSPRWARGRPAPRCVLLADSAGNDGGAAGQTAFARGGPRRWPRRSRRRPRAAGAEVRTGAEVVAAARARRRGSTGVALAVGRGDRGARRGVRRRPEDRAHALARPRGGRPAAALARRQHPHAGRDRRRRAAAVGSPAFTGVDDRRAAVAGGSSSRRASTTSSGPSTAGSTAR